MMTKLVKSDEGYLLVFEQSLLDQLQINPNTPLDLKVEGGSLHIVPIRDGDYESLGRKTLNDANQKSGDAARRLAD